MVLLPLSNSWIIIMIWLYIALNRTPNIDGYWGGSTQGLGFRVDFFGQCRGQPREGLGLRMSVPRPPTCFSSSQNDFKDGETLGTGIGGVSGGSREP